MTPGGRSPEQGPRLGVSYPREPVVRGCAGPERQLRATLRPQLGRAGLVDRGRDVGVRQAGFRRSPPKRSDERQPRGRWFRRASRLAVSSVTAAVRVLVLGAVAWKGCQRRSGVMSPAE